MLSLQQTYPHWGIREDGLTGETGQSLCGTLYGTLCQYNTWSVIYRDRYLGSSGSVFVYYVHAWQKGRRDEETSLEARNCRQKKALH